MRELAYTVSYAVVAAIGCCELTFVSLLWGPSGQRAEFMPTSRGFDYYLGVPFSVDMGNTVWRKQTVGGDNGVLPLVEGTARGGFSIVEQPAKLENLTARYVDAATGWIRQQASVEKRFVLYIPFSHGAQLFARSSVESRPHLMLRMALSCSAQSPIL